MLKHNNYKKVTAMTPEEKEQTSTENQEPKKPTISIGGAAPVRTDDTISQDDDTPSIFRQTLIMDQKNKDNDGNADGQVFVIGPQMTEEQKEANAEYISNSQMKKAAQKKQHPKHYKLLITLLFVLLLTGAAGAGYYFIFS